MTFNQDLLEKIILLVMTALISGFGIPYFLKRIEERKLREQKKFEADLARQNKIIEAQSKFLDDLSQVLWNWRYLAKKVVYYGGRENKTRYEIARKEYDDNVWDILNAFRTEVSKARRLVSEEAYKELRAMYDYIVGDIDLRISDIIKSDELDANIVAASTDLGARFSVEVSQRIDDLIDHLAGELGLKVKK
jgi:uncharacterized protein YutD